MLEAELKRVLRMDTIPVTISLDDFERFKAVYHDPRPSIDDEKYLEYYVSYKWLAFNRGDVFIDIAAQDCPFAWFLRDSIGCRALRQDLYYLASGISEDGDVGGDAGNLPLPDGYVTKMDLHNSFEHFEGSSDTEFIIEAQRILAPEGKICIIPLNMGLEYSEEHDAGWIDAEGRKHPWGLGARFARQYDPSAFKQRVLDCCHALSVTLYAIENALEISSRCYARYFAIFEKTC